MGKTAVIIIHGVGEQRPMGTVSEFTRLFAGDYFRSKPDLKSKLFELRRLSTHSDDASNTPEQNIVKKARGEYSWYPADTVFYEFYWAFHYRDTKPALVINWCLTTLAKLFTSRQFYHLPKRVVSVAAACVWALIIFAAAIFLISLGLSELMRQDGHRVWGALSLAGGVILPWILAAFKPLLLGWAGDAARYFGASPDNPIERQQIREEGIALLKRLHEELGDDGNLRYDNIIVAGHSLGSVIAYDLVVNYWIGVHTRIEIDQANADLNAIEALAPYPPTDARRWKMPKNAGAEDYQSRQARLVASLVGQTNKNGELVEDFWRVRDLVTMGSPLTYGRFLLASNAKELCQRQAQRELPTCPPTKDRNPDIRQLCGSFVYQYPPTMKANSVVPDQAAPFLLTRWTNIYFPNDPIGGPLRPFFGWGIRDVQVDFRPAPSAPGKAASGGRGGARPLIDLFGGAHVRYWTLKNGKPDDPESPSCATTLREIVVRAKNTPVSPRHAFGTPPPPAPPTGVSNGPAPNPVSVATFTKSPSATDPTVSPQAVSTAD